MTAPGAVNRPAVMRGTPSRKRLVGVLAWGSISIIGLTLIACGPRTDETTVSPSGRSPTAGGSLAQASQTDLAAAFGAASETVFQMRTGDELIGQPGQQISLSTSADGLRVTATGNDPQMILPRFAEGKQLIFKFVIQSPAQTTLQLYYPLLGSPSYTEAQSCVFPLAAGRNVGYCALSSPAIGAPIRLDVGSVAGEYVLEDLTARVLLPPR